MRIVIFGAGEVYRKYKPCLNKEISVVAFLDNNREKWGTYLDGVQIHNPVDILNLEYDKIVLLSVRAHEMKEQLFSLGVEKEKICYKEEFNRFFGGTTPTVYGTGIGKQMGKKIAIVTTDIDYNGGTLAAIYAAQALKYCGYGVCMIVPGGNKLLIDTIVKEGISIYIYSSLPYLYNEEIQSINSCDAVIVNVFQMLKCACEISKVRPTIWWIHEASDRISTHYSRTKHLYPQYANAGSFQKVNIYGVSKIAVDAFNEQYPSRAIKVLEFGIPDERVSGKSVKTRKKIFAIIGSIIELKNQRLFLETIKGLSQEERRGIECWIIGKCGNAPYAKEFQEEAKLFPQVKLCGELNREELQEAFKYIDVVLCTSLEETMSIAVIEGMMNGKICVTSDKTGIASYVNDGINGFVFRNNDVECLLKIVRKIIDQDDWDGMREKARETYEKFFTMSKFAHRLLNAISETIEQWNK